MAIGYESSKTLSPNNKFTFTCPIFGAEVAIAGCFQLRDLVWKGDRPGVRRGCQAAMSASKCPIHHILTDMMRRGTDPYHSDVPKHGSLEQAHLDHIAPILVREATIMEYDVVDRARELLREGNEKAHQGIVIVSAHKRVVPASKPRATKAIEPPVEVSLPVIDMAALVNAVSDQE